LTEKKLTSRQLQAIETKDKICEAGINLMQKHGFDNVTIEEISKEVGVSVGAIYHYYKSKNEIMYDIYKQADEFFEKIVADKIKGYSSKEKIIKYFGYYGTYNSQRGYNFVSKLYSPNNKKFNKKNRYMQVLLHEIIIEGQHKKEILLEYSAEYIVEYLFVLARGIVFSWCLTENSYCLEDKIQEYMEIAIKVFIP
jgi:AcrR family transcriptional regulator